MHHVLHLVMNGIAASSTPPFLLCVLQQSCPVQNSVSETDFFRYLILPPFSEPEAISALLLLTWREIFGSFFFHFFSFSPSIECNYNPLSVTLSSLLHVPNASQSASQFPLEQTFGEKKKRRERSVVMIIILRDFFFRRFSFSLSITSFLIWVWHE